MTINLPSIKTTVTKQSNTAKFIKAKLHVLRHKNRKKEEKKVYINLLTRFGFSRERNNFGFQQKREREREGKES